MTFSLLTHCRVPVGLPDVGHYPELFIALLDSGTWDVEDLKKLAGLNFLRVLMEVEQVVLVSLIAIHNPLSPNSGRRSIC